MNLIYQGSVKNIYSGSDKETLFFKFSDRYSIFDWGGMPDELPEKGKGLALMADHFFQFLGEGKNWEPLKNDSSVPGNVRESKALIELIQNGLSHHSLGLRTEVNGELKPTSEKSNILAVKAVQVLKPIAERMSGKLSWNYDVYKTDRPKDSLVPLEVIFRFGIPAGSSLLGRLGDKDYCASLGVSPDLKEGDEFDFPIVEFSTKLEERDRYISYDEARRIAGLTDSEFDRLKNMALLLAYRLKKVFSEIGIKLWDGKFEFAFDGEVSPGDRNIMLVDSIGPDELRLTYNGTQLSKENLRKYYRDSDWFKSVNKAKELAQERGVEDWQEICANELNSTPQNLSSDKVELMSMMYKTLTNAFATSMGKSTPFENVMELDELVARMS